MNYVRLIFFILIAFKAATTMASESTDARIDLLVSYGIMSEEDAITKKLNLRQQPPSEKILIEKAKRHIANLSDEEEVAPE